ncbi:MAG: hypothetical protein ABIC40_00750, partial [bacterium]
IIANLIKAKVNINRESAGEIPVTPFSGSADEIADETTGDIGQSDDSIDPGKRTDNILPSRRLDFRDGIGFRISDDNGKSVTPFGNISDKEITREIDTEIFKEYRDNKIEEYLKWGDLEKAADRAKDCLAKATGVGDKNSVRLYKAYLALLGEKDIPD